MNQKRLYRTIETVAAGKFQTEEEMLETVLNQIVFKEEAGIIGGRLWRLDAANKSYKLFFQTGNLEKITDNFQIYIEDYPVFEMLATDRTVLSDETNMVLREKGIFKYSVSGVGSRQKVDGKPFYEFLLALNSNNINDELRHTLNIVATVLTSQLKQRRISENAQHMKADIDRAKQLQKSILPEHEYKFHNFEMFGLTLPAEIIGGDFFDYLKIGDDEERLGIAVGDAASKGLSAAAEAMYVSGALRMASAFQIKISPLMKKMNELVHKIFSEAKFTTLFYGEVATDKNGLFLYANAGHNPPIFIKSSTCEATYLMPTGPLLGPAPHAKYETENLNFSKGDVLLIYTDGITDAANTEEECYEEKRLEKTLKEVIHLSPKEIAYTILNDVIHFSKDGTYSDDKTLVVIKRTM
ncbi:MAG TPA: PP2C family protein-serine/threonine phosphatase [Ignavibacteriales bacterium]|nr:PP2C family protein-serine/threonine phosphatase [Ignavibacteriales bacterium]